MRELIKGRVSPYYYTETEMLFLGDTFSVLKNLAHHWFNYIYHV